MTGAIRFGIVAESARDGPAWADHARAAEDAGVGSLLLRDHFSAGAFGQYALCLGQSQVDVLGYSALPINLVEAAFTQADLQGDQNTVMVFYRGHW